MRKILGLMALAAVSVSAVPQTNALAQPVCDYNVVGGHHPTSGDFQCFMYWTCTDGSWGYAYTDESLCGG